MSTKNSNFFSRDCMVQALIQLLKAKSLSNFTITELTERAGVSRMTYYRNYHSLDEIFSSYLKDLVEYQEGQVVSKTLVQNDYVSMTIFSFDKGEEISTHAAGGDAMVTVLEGKGRFTVGDEVFYVEEGETLIMPKDIPHAVYGEERFKMQLTVSF